MSPVKGGIIAAGHGTRFKEKGVDTHKALLMVAGKPLLAWAFSQFASAGISDITIIFNEDNADLCTQYLRDHFPQLKIDILVKTTASSYESFCRVTQKIGVGPCLVTTIDSIYQPGKFREFLQAAQNHPAGSMTLGVTSFVDDEKPLYTTVDTNNRITSLGGDKSQYVTNGVYWIPAFSHQAFDKFSALRHFLKSLIDEDTLAYGFDMGKSIDIDHPKDIAVAEAFLSGFLKP